jgi:hypothetical protein
VAAVLPWFKIKDEAPFFSLDVERRRWTLKLPPSPGVSSSTSLRHTHVLAMTFLRPFALLLATSVILVAADSVFSGPQPGEKATPFKVIALSGDAAGKERDPVAEAEDRTTAIVFIHTVERSLLPLLRVIDEYGAKRPDRIKTEVVLLFADRLEGEQRGKAIAGSLKLNSAMGLSVDGAEGPGNYGLNKECMMTIVAAKDQKVLANFALVQPGIADAPKVIEALAKACGDEAPPTVEQLSGRVAARGVGREAAPMRPGAPRMDAPTAPDLSRFDLNTEAGLRDAVRALVGEVQSLRNELNAMRAGNPSPAPRDGAPARPVRSADGQIPGAVPTDEKLAGLLRQFIRPTNEDAAVDQVLANVQAHIKDNADLRKQAIDGWRRILHFEHYGTAYSRKVGREFLDKLQKEGR